MAVILLLLKADRGQYHEEELTVALPLAVRLKVWRVSSSQEWFASCPSTQQLGMVHDQKDPDQHAAEGLVAGV